MRDNVLMAVVRKLHVVVRMILVRAIVALNVMEIKLVVDTVILR